MSNITKIIRWTCITLLATSLHSCILEGGNACESNVKFVFEYNLLEVDAFHKQASYVDLFLFNESGTFLHRIHGNVPEGLKDNTYRITLPAGFENATQMIAWAGLDNDAYNIPEMTVGVSTMDDLKITLADTDGEINRNYNPLLWGYIELPQGVSYNNETIELPMRKNTNSIRIVLTPDPNEPFAIDVDEFDFKFVSANGSYNCQNLCFDDIERVYIPHYTANAETRANDEIHNMAVAEISTVRLKERLANQLKITHTSTEQSIIDVEDLNNFLKKLQLAKYGKYEFQEYLDREDNYAVVIFLGRQQLPDGNYSYAATNILINNWIVREQDVDHD